MPLKIAFFSTKIRSGRTPRRMSLISFPIYCRVSISFWLRTRRSRLFFSASDTCVSSGFTYVLISFPFAVYTFFLLLLKPSFSGLNLGGTIGVEAILVTAFPSTSATTTPIHTEDRSNDTTRITTLLYSDSLPNIRTR